MDIRRIVLFVIVLFVLPPALRAQQMSESYYAENPREDFEVATSNDTLIFYTPYIHQPAVERLLRYAFGYIDYDRRGQNDNQSLWVGRIPLSTPLGRYGDFFVGSILRRLPSQRSYTYSTSDPMEALEQGRGEHFNLSTFGLEEVTTLKLQYSERGYRAGAYLSSVGALGQSGWRYSLAAGGRLGRDAGIEGHYNNSGYLWTVAERSSKPDDWGYVRRVIVGLLVPTSERAPRSWSTTEVYDLAADRYYNSSWGYQAERVRPSRVKGETVPLLYASWRLTDRYNISDDVSIDLVARAGSRYSSSLDWSNASNPQPDHYTRLPSWYADSVLAEEVREAWRSGNTSYCQVDWPLLYQINRLSPRGAVYAMVNDCERVRSLQLNFSTGAGRNLWSPNALPDPEGVSRGRLNIFAEWHNSRFDNAPSDLLGADRLAEGFELYDYLVEYRGVGSDYSFGFGGDFGRVGVGTRVELHSLRYDNRLSGHSIDSGTMADVDLKATWHYQMGWNRMVGSELHYNYDSPRFCNLVAAPEGVATLNRHARGEHRVGGEVWAIWSRGRVSGSLNMYADYCSGVSDIRNFWNDLESLYCVMAVGGAKTLSVGVEATLTFPLGGGFVAETVATLGRHSYCSDAQMDIYAHDTGVVVAEGSLCHVDGQRASASPEAALALRVGGELWDGWSLMGEGAICWGRYVVPSFFFCSDYVLGLNLTPEAYEEFVAQPSLGVAPNLNLMISKSFDGVDCSLSLRNLLCGGALYGGYRPNRIIARESLNIRHYAPHPTRYQYTYPPHIYLTIGYVF